MLGVLVAFQIISRFVMAHTRVQIIDLWFLLLKKAKLPIYANAKPLRMAAFVMVRTKTSDLMENGEWRMENLLDVDY